MGNYNVCQQTPWCLDFRVGLSPCARRMDPKEVQKRLAAALRSRREELGLTQEEAAEKCGVSTRYWRDLEAAVPSVSLEVADKIFVGLGWSWSDVPTLLGRRVPPTTAPRSVHDLLDQAWQRLTPRERQHFTGNLRVLTSRLPAARHK